MKRSGAIKRRRTMTARALAAQKANAAKRVYVRRGKSLTCETCGKEFYAEPRELGRRRYCSRACMGAGAAVERTCSVCSATFTSKWPRKTCSPRCAGAAKSRSKVAVRNPNYNGGVSARKAAWRAAAAFTCALCRSNRRLVQHHVVYEQHVRKYGGNEWDVRDALTVCFDCHNAHHHNPDFRIRVSQLRPENLAFAAELLGDYAPDYLARFYEVDRELCA